MIQYDSAENEDDRKMFEVLLMEHSPGKNAQVIRTADPEIFSNWVNMAILSMCRIQAFPIERSRIASAFIQNVDPTLIDQSLDLLIRSGLIHEDDNGRLTREEGTTLSGWTNQKNSGAREYYRQVSDLAKDAIDLDMMEREFQCFSLALDKTKVPQVKELIRNFRTTLLALTDERANEVYQVNLQLFPLTDQNSK